MGDDRRGNVRQNMIRNRNGEEERNPGQKEQSRKERAGRKEPR